MKTNEKKVRKTVGIRFRANRKIYDFDCGSLVLRPGDQVIVETEKGLGLGTVYLDSISIKRTVSEKNLKKVFRKADREDLEQLSKNKKLERDAFLYCMSNIQKLDLDMNLFTVESTFDTNRLTFFFTADGRIDFRQLVKILVKKFRCRIEMRQVGVRNQAKMCGGVGRCGQILCCASFLNKFEPISIKMAKCQGLSLNPTKISGQCGRLMCCLAFENEVYKEIKSDLPKIGKTIKIKNTEGKVISHNVMQNSITLYIDGKKEDIKISQIKQYRGDEKC